MKNLLWGVTVVFLLIALGCSADQGMITSGDIQPVPLKSASKNHFLWGFYSIQCDRELGTLEITSLRDAAMHLNAIIFLEPPPLVNLTLESAPVFNGDILDVDIGLRHPFLGLTEFSGFDVCGTVISSGSYTGYSDGAINFAGPGDLYLANADGHSRWWNPGEYPVNTGTMFGYNDGLLGAPDDFANYDATINGYKYFTDTLAPNDPVSGMDHTTRGLFSAGQKNVRHYTIDLGTAGLVFNYAIDANWQFPNGDPPWMAPDDFGPEANRIEPYLIDVVETANSLWYFGGTGGGSLSMDINLYDWFNLDQDSIRIECPGVFTMIETAVPDGGTSEYSTFSIDITSPTIPSSDDLMILITAETEDVGFQDFLPGISTSAYKVHYAAVSDEPTGPPPTAVADSIPLIGFTNFAGDFDADGCSGQIDLYEWDFDGDGSYDWSNPTTGNTTHAYTVEDIFDAMLKVSNTGGFDTDTVQIRMIDPLPIIQNGNFWDGTYDNWVISEGGQGSVNHYLIDDPTYKLYNRVVRTGSGNDGGGSRFTQVMNVDVSAYSELYFNSFFKIVNQSLPGDGYWGTYGGWGEFPYAVFIWYLNQNDQLRFVCYGYIRGNADSQWEWDKSQWQSSHWQYAYYEYEANIPTNVWQERKTIDLMTLGVDAPKEIQTIWIWSSGWDYEAHWILPWFSDH